MLCFPSPGGLQCRLVYFLSLPWCGLTPSPKSSLFLPSYPCSVHAPLSALLTVWLFLAPDLGGGRDFGRSKSQTHSPGEWSGVKERVSPGKEGAIQLNGEWQTAVGSLSLLGAEGEPQVTPASHLHLLMSFSHLFCLSFTTASFILKLQGPVYLFLGVVEEQERWRRR